MLVTSPLWELFALKVPFASGITPTMFHYYRRSGVGLESAKPALNTGIMLIRPSLETVHDMQQKIQTGMSSSMMKLFGTTVQPFLDTYFAEKSRRIWCADLESLCLQQPNACDENGTKTKLHCLLTHDYNFFVDFKNVRHQILNNIDRSNDTLEANIRRNIIQANWSLPQIKVLHWPGEFRKPWEHWSPLARSTFDQKWWTTYDHMCTVQNCSMQC
eukprot:GEMP01088234.1.p1 GENE.GEMP01088234.1~~GEMP01088234.1.p1  ORF type:complete len:216 (+),score=30.11 GEMP01088234.1:80-727(+)